ncbi:MAG: hypothetical protein WBC09_01915 [Thermoanaerobaculia bacterium]
MLALIAGPALVALVVLYHAFLLWQRVADLTLLEPAVAVRWLATLLLLLGLFRLHHRGVPLIWGRKALVFWLLVLLLHVSFYGPLAEGVEASFDIHGAGLMLALPATVVVSSLAAVCLALLVRFLGVLPVLAPPTFSPLDAPGGPSQPAGWTLQLACRPPPA